MYEVSGARILFGPKKSYTSIIRQRLLADPRFYSVRHKEYEDFPNQYTTDMRSYQKPVLKDSGQYLEDYLANSNKIFVDTSLFFYHDTKLNRLAPMRFLGGDYLIYFFRNFYDLLKSDYVYKQVKHGMRFDFLDNVKHYSFRMFHERIFADLNYQGQVFIAQRYNLNNILNKTIQLQIPESDEYANEWCYGTSNFKSIGKSYFEYLVLMNEVLNRFENELIKYKTQVLETARENLEYKNRYIHLDDFDEEEYLRNLI